MAREALQLCAGIAAIVSLCAWLSLLPQVRKAPQIVHGELENEKAIGLSFTATMAFYERD